MATQKTVAWFNAKLLLGDGVTPNEGFTAPCALRTRGINFESTQSETAPLDCLDESIPVGMKRVTVTKTATISGTGVVDPDDLATWRAYFTGGAAKNVRFQVAIPLADGGGYWQGPFILRVFELTAERDGEGVVAFSLELISAGDITWTDASA